jgi:hypothetical protein
MAVGREQCGAFQLAVRYLDEDGVRELRAGEAEGLLAVRIAGREMGMMAA